MPTEDILTSKFEIILAHPEVFFHSKTGKDLLDNPDFCTQVLAVFIDECHTIETW